MPNQKSTASRTLAFWFGLTLHLALGTAMYYQATSQPASRVQPAHGAIPVAVTPAKP